MATKMLTEEQTEDALYALRSAQVNAELHADAFHWISALIGTIKLGRAVAVAARRDAQRLREGRH